MDLTKLQRFLFIEVLTVKENVLYMSFNAIKHKKKQIHGIGTEIKKSLKLFET